MHNDPIFVIAFLVSDRQNEEGNTVPLVNDEACASTPEARRLTRSMCATPKNDNKLPEATGTVVIAVYSYIKSSFLD